MTSEPRIICISNRLAVSASETPDSVEFQPSSGGLVTAIGPILRRTHGIWIGWPGALKSGNEKIIEALAGLSAQSEFDLFAVSLNSGDIEGFYQGFSNQIIWPLFHDLQGRCNFEPSFWSAYLKVQQLFYDETIKHVNPEDLIWIHDYHLMGLGQVLRKGGVKNQLCFFLHTPFPSPDIFSKLPWRLEVLNSLLEYNLTGFQTTRDLENFIACLRRLTQVKISQRGAQYGIQYNDHECLAGSFPISIDFKEFAEIASSPEVEARCRQIRQDINVEYIVLSIDRLDYTKGIPFRIKAFKRLLEIEPELKRRVVLLQVVVPSRVEVPEYQLLKAEVEQLVSQLNGTLGEPGWVPVHHLFRSLTREDVLAMYRASDVALITPLKDGMNLVAKEYCASRVNNGGALVLSEFAGVADELGEYSFLVNPCDLDAVAQSISGALKHSQVDSRGRMASMRKVIENADVFNWASSFLYSAGWNWQSYDSQPSPRPTTLWQSFRRITKVFDI